MATASSTITVTPTSVINSNTRTKKGNNIINAKYIRGVNGFNGLKAENSVTSLGGSVCCEQGFAKVVSSLKKGGRKSGGGAFSSTCNAAGEIFQIAAIMNGLTLVGVAVGFVLLRIEAFVEEAE